ncbi:hypothetical protein P7C70_g2564, partial [Phenoliferia sp. Uapishka_3]
MHFTTLSVVTALSLASAISAHAGAHHNGKRAHGNRAARAWGRRDGSTDSSSGAAFVGSATTTDSGSASTFLSVVPDVVTGAITISNTAAAAPQQTAAAVGADRGDTTPLPACEAENPFGGYCDPTTTDCCLPGKAFCVGNVCTACTQHS